jgi:hypothetical protein
MATILSSITLQNVLVLLLGILTGTVVGTLPGFLNDLRVHRNERAVIRKSLMLECIYMHKSTLFLNLDAHQNEPDGPFHGVCAHSQYSTVIYDTYIEKIGSLFDPDYALQIHYYYSNIKKLNHLSDLLRESMSDQLIKGYLGSSIHTYGMLFGLLGVLSNKEETKKNLKENVKGLIEDSKPQQRDVDLFLKYNLKGVAKSIERDLEIAV